CEAIEANCSSSALERPSASARRSSATLAAASCSFAAASSSALRRTLVSRTSAKALATANSVKITQGTHLCAPLTEANRELSGAVETTFHGEPSTGAETKYWALP